MLTEPELRPGITCDVEVGDIISANFDIDNNLFEIYPPRGFVKKFYLAKNFLLAEKIWRFGVWWNSDITIKLLESS